MYKKFIFRGIEQPCVIRIADNAFIPFNPANTDFSEYLKWLAEGNQPLPPDEPTLSETV
jgi:hypothetical protein